MLQQIKEVFAFVIDLIAGFPLGGLVFSVLMHFANIHVTTSQVWLGAILGAIGYTLIASRMSWPGFIAGIVGSFVAADFYVVVIDRIWYVLEGYHMSHAFSGFGYRFFVALFFVVPYMLRQRR